MMRRLLQRMDRFWVWLGTLPAGAAARNWFARRSIRDKLTGVVMGVVVLAMTVVSGFALLGVVLNTRDSLRTTRDVVGTLGDVTALSVASALAFNDAKSAANTLSTLGVHPQILEAELLQANGEVFARYEPDSGLPLLVRLAPGWTTTMVQRPVEISAERLGQLRMRVDLVDLWRVFVMQIGIMLAGLGFGVLAAYTLMQRLSQAILRPVEHLGALARRVSESREYALRAQVTTQDELGALAGEFNTMLEQIEQRDAQLREHTEALEQTQEVVCLADASARFRYVNRAFTRTFGYTLDEVRERAVTLLKPDSFGVDPRTQQEMRLALVNGAFSGEVTLMNKSGQRVPMFVNIGPVRARDGTVAGYVGTGHDVSDKQRAEALIRRQANYDDLTSLPNRRMFHECLERAIADSARSKAPLALMLLDLDGFKEVNDALGHDAGDLLLRQVSQRLAQAIASTDTLSRIGGDEFTIIVQNISGTGRISRLADSLLTALAEPFQLDRDLVYVSISIGIALYPSDSSSVEELLKHADQAMYDAKKRGRNGVRYFTPGLQEAAQARMQIVNDLRLALAQNEFRVMYQPIVDFRSGQVRKAEALLRWQHPVRGMVSPAEFIPIAEETGQIVDIGDWVFRQAVAQVQRWRERLHPQFQISVNKSPVQFRAAEARSDAWFDLLRLHGLNGSAIAIEITEGLLMDSSRLVVQKLFQFRERGMQISLDDFGTGYSSLSYLNRLDIDYVKIDQSFVRTLRPDSKELALCEGIIAMAHKLGMRVIAEGVETRTHWELLHGMGCDMGQGYLFSRPLAPADFERLVAGWRPFNPSQGPCDDASDDEAEGPSTLFIDPENS